MQYIIKTRNSQGRKVYVKADEAKHKVTGDIVYTGFTRNKHLAHHYANLKEAQSALQECRVAYDHLSLSLEAHIPYTTGEGMSTEPVNSLLRATMRAIRLFPDIDFEHLKWSDGFYTGMNIFDVNDLVKGWEGKHTFVIRARLGEVHIYMDGRDQASYWTDFL